MTSDHKPHSFHTLSSDDVNSRCGQMGQGLQAEEVDPVWEAGAAGRISYISTKSRSGASGSMVENIITPTSSSFSAFLFPVFHSCKEECYDVKVGSGAKQLFQNPILASAHWLSLSFQLSGGSAHAVSLRTPESPTPSHTWAVWTVPLCRTVLKSSNPLGARWPRTCSFPRPTHLYKHTRGIWQRTSKF